MLILFDAQLIVKNDQNHRVVPRKLMACQVVQQMKKNVVEKQNVNFSGVLAAEIQALEYEAAA